MRVTKTPIPSTHGNLDAVIHYPDVDSDKLAILCPGFLDTKDYRHLTRLAEDLAAHEYTAVRFDPTGTWESEGTINDYTTTQYLEDVKNVLEYILAKKPHQRVVLAGHSRGGLVSLLYASRDPRVSSVIGIMSSIGRTMDWEKRQEWQRAGIKKSTRIVPGARNSTREFAVPYTHIVDRDQYNVLNTVHKITAPILLIASEQDDKVPLTDVQEIYNAAHEPKKIIVLPNLDHNYRHDENDITRVNQVIVDFLKQ